MSSDVALSIEQFCLLNNISKWSYQMMRKNGHGPKELRIPGTSVVRILPEANAAWRARMEQLATTKTMQLESARRAKQRTAGRSSAKRKRAAA